MKNLPPIPKDRNWPPETWRAGLDEAVRLCGFTDCKTWQEFIDVDSKPFERRSILAHATTLLDAGIVKPVNSEADVLLEDILSYDVGSPQRISVIQSALDKARAGDDTGTKCLIERQYNERNSEN